MARTLTVSLGEEWQAYAQMLVDSGDYGSVSEVMRGALRALRDQRANSKLEQLRRLIAEGDASGTAVELTAERFLARMQKNDKHDGQTQAVVST